MLTAGDEAPDFELRSHRGGTVKLSDFRGKKNVVLAFHPLAFTPVCANQMRGYEDDRRGSRKLARRSSASALMPNPRRPPGRKTLDPISYDLLSDFHPHGEVATKYGVFRQKEGFSERAIFVIDKRGRIAWSKVYDIPEQPNNDGSTRGTRTAHVNFARCAKAQADPA